MPEKWTGDIIGKMHANRVSHASLAKQLGCTKAYVSMVLNGTRRPAGAEQKFNEALDAILQKQAGYSQHSTP